MDGYGYGGLYGGGGGSPPPAQLYRNRIVALTPSSFPPGTDPNMVACFQTAGQDESGLVDDRELQRALSSCNQGEHSAFALFAFLLGKINGPELTEAFLSIGFVVPPVVVDLLVTNYDKNGDGSGQLNMIISSSMLPPISLLNICIYFLFYGSISRTCCLIVKGLTKIFKDRDTMLSSSATFTYEAFTLAILPFLIA
ncbi:hypothetical protein ACJRO7_036066 [Eucalyptus globulus]|uniref:Uncharacterized protein n=1 Tax=Eucalyptus globulus TaxID=34317 RepID=A0ABD3JB94_EUCGL